MHNGNPPCSIGQNMKKSRVIVDMLEIQSANLYLLFTLNIFIEILIEYGKVGTIYMKNINKRHFFTKICIAAT